MNFISSNSPQAAFCHKQIREVARAAAGELYERFMEQNEYYEEWKKQNPDASPAELQRRFIDRNWPKCIDFARKTLALMLKRPDISDEVKEDIVDILAKDQLLLRGRGRVIN
jgi:sugar-specific transcriptional regulator TrmB